MRASEPQGGEQSLRTISSCQSRRSAQLSQLPASECLMAKVETAQITPPCAKGNRVQLECWYNRRRKTYRNMQDPNDGPEPIRPERTFRRHEPQNDRMSRKYSYRCPLYQLSRPQYHDQGSA